jgi:hypothetical protein
MTKPQWRTYEEFVKSLYERISGLEGVKTISLEHDVSLQGKTTKHQIDVHWVFELAGLRHEIIIQAKDWSKPVSQGEVGTFAWVRSDLPGNPLAIMVARSGFQSGAETAAIGSGIHLYELREPRDSDLDGRVKEIRVTLHTRVPNVRRIQLNFDPVWQTTLTRPLTFGMREDEAFLQDSTGASLGTVHSIIQGLVPASDEGVHQTYTHLFSEPTFLRTNDDEFPLAQIASIEADIAVFVAPPIEIATSYKDVISHILKSVTGDISYLVDHDGGVRRISSADTDGDVK